MAVLSVEDLRRCWMRRKYIRLGIQASGGRRRLKVEKLGANHQRWVLKTTKASRNQNQLGVCSGQVKLLGCLHDKYVTAMFGWANGVAKTKSLFLGKKVAKKDGLVSVTSGEQVDVKLVFEMYKRVVLSRNLNVL